jgi:hypothetical protein
MPAFADPNQVAPESVAPHCASPLIAIGDLHGQLDLFDLLLGRIDSRYPKARIVTLGDCVDNGPQICLTRSGAAAQ